MEEGQWHAHAHGGYYPLAVDLTGFWRPRLRNCPTTHYHAAAGRALPAIPLGLIARIGSAGTQRQALPLAFVRAEIGDPHASTHARLLVREAVSRCAGDEVLVLDAGFGVALLQEEGATRFVVRLPKNAAFRRAKPPPYSGRGRPATRGALVRPLSRTYRGRALPATPPDRVETWSEADLLLRAEVWTEVVPPDVGAGCPTLTVLVLHDPRHREPLLLATPLPLAPRAARDCYRDRWPVEQLPLAAKQILGAARQFVHAPETCQRLPELALLAGAILSYIAATSPAIPTGFWDRHPRPTPGRLRRYLARHLFPHDFLLPHGFGRKRPPPRICLQVPGANSGGTLPPRARQYLAPGRVHVMRSPELPETRVQMIGHNHERIQFDRLMVICQPRPILSHDVPVGVQPHRIVHDFTEDRCMLVWTYDDKIRACLAVIVILQADGVPMMDCGIVRDHRNFP